MMKALRLQRGHVAVGKPLPWNVYDIASQLLLSRGYVIERESQLTGLLERGMYVDSADYEASIDKNADRGQVRNYNPFRLWDDMVAKLFVQLQHPSKELGFSGQITDIGRLVQLLSQRNADTVLAIIMLTMDHRRYTTVHSMQAAVLCDMIANRLGWEKPRRLEAICAALTMNIGMLELQQQLTNQRTPLTEEQKRLVREHPVTSVELLRRAGVDSHDWLLAVEEHHETANGGGYPRGITELQEEAALLRTMDVYCAKISPRMHRKPMSGTQAERVLFSETGMSGDNPYIPTLIKEIGIYPPGTFVKLINGETGIVYKRSTSINTPLVMSLINANGTPLIEPIRRDTSKEAYKIVNDVPRESILINVDPAKIWTEN